MEQREKMLDGVERYLLEQGLTISQLLTHCAKKDSELLSLSPDNLRQYRSTYDQIESGALNKTQKGKLLEQLVELLFETGSLFDRRKNYRTSTNEIDLMLTWSSKARNAGIPNVFPCFGDVFICECKNYAEPVDVTYVGKFYSLLASSDLPFGVLVAWNGVTGKRGWAAANGLIRKIALRDKVYIVTLDKNDLKMIYQNNRNIYSILLEKKEALQNDIDYEKYIQQHEAEVHFHSPKMN